ncbi:hypothetical protein TP2_05410 [Thioclava pacifica DSM 10166]|uniref:Uncharacterized protein n=1 Tax=Thioclava pacifica DSM 10166 TaxID=1353537 RepID=A0A074JEQ9_9RHOB|nr:hypothetical protein TP2_05410 [Thioclava pacifica DSM 10166]
MDLWISGCRTLWAKLGITGLNRYLHKIRHLQGKFAKVFYLGNALVPGWGRNR